MGPGLHMDNPLSRLLGVRKSGWFTYHLCDLDKITLPFWMSGLYLSNWNPFRAVFLERIQGTQDACIKDMHTSRALRWYKGGALRMFSPTVSRERFGPKINVLSFNTQSAPTFCLSLCWVLGPQGFFTLSFIYSFNEYAIELCVRHWGTVTF